MTVLKIKDGFTGEKQVNIPEHILLQYINKNKFTSALYITHIGYFPKAKFHFRERTNGCPDNILIYCVGGKGHYYTDTENYVLKAHQFMLLPPEKIHMYQADINDPWTIYWIHFSGTLLTDLNKRLSAEKYIQPTNIEYDKKIIEQWSEMYDALETGYTENSLAFANLCLYRFLSFFLCQAGVFPAVKEGNPIGESIAFMKSNIDKVLTVQDLANHLKYSSSHYTALFREKTGVAPIEYFIKLKIQYACLLLNQSNFKINEIADKVGYADCFYFSRLFKKITGKSPKDYRFAFKKVNAGDDG